MMEVDNLSFYKEFISFKSIFYFCSLPLRLDSYKGCGFGCLYCFSQNLNYRNENFFNTAIPANPLLFSKRMRRTQIEGNDVGVINSCLLNRIPIHLGSVSDPFQPAEKKYRISFELLKILADYSYPTVISTKSTLLWNKEYLDLLKKFPVSIQISLSTYDNVLAKKIEPNAPSPEDRLLCLRILGEKGFYTVVRLQPYLLNHSTDIEDLLIKLSKNMVKHVVLEHLRIPTTSTLKTRNLLWENLGENYLELYKQLGITRSRINYELSSEIKIETVKKVRKICHSLGMTFGSGDNDLHHLSDSFCCCGLACKSGFTNFYDGHLGYIAHKAFQTGKINVSEIEKKWQPKGSIREFINSECRNDGNSTIKDYLSDRVSNNKRSNSLDSFFGIEYDSLNGYYIIEEKRKMAIES
jgi:DNA repair photolyase